MDSDVQATSTSAANLLTPEEFSTRRREMMNALTRVAEAPLELHPAVVQQARLALSVFLEIEGAEIEVPDDNLPFETTDIILHWVANAHHVSCEQLLGRYRAQHIVFAREVAVYFLRRLMRCSFPEIGRRLNRDHSTAIHSYNLIDRRVKREQAFRLSIERMERAILQEIMSNVTTDDDAYHAARD